MAFLRNIPAFLDRMSPRKRYLISFAAGAVSALAFAPLDIFPALLAGFAMLVLLIDVAARQPRPIRTAALTGWCFGFGQFLIGLHWIAFPFLVDPVHHAWQLPFALTILPGALALFPALAMAVAGKFWRTGATRIFLFTLCYGVAEWLRGHILTGFPWNLPAYGWGASLSILQSVALIGAYGLTTLTVLFGASLAEFCQPQRRFWRLPAALILLFALIWTGGFIHLQSHPTRWVKNVRLRLVQPDIPQTEKYLPHLMVRNWERLTRLSTAPTPGKPAPNVVIWPEAAPPFLLTRVPDAIDWIDSMNARGITVMTGALRAEKITGKTGRHSYRYFNSFYAFAGGKPVAVYDKFHLVPFGEYLPFEKTLNKLGLQKLTGIAGSFGRGSGPRSFTAPHLPAFGPLICYEILFPGQVVGKTRPAWFVNISDDAWFGPWAGPHQHLLIARTRAIEEGIPVVRDTSSGISAIIDPLGRITAKSGLNRATFLDGGLPQDVPQTPYGHFHAYIPWLIFFLLLILTFIRRDKKCKR